MTATSKPTAGDKLREWRLAEAMTLLQLANRLETTPSTIQRWETGFSRPSSMVLRKHIERITRGAVRANDWVR